MIHFREISELGEGEGLVSGGWGSGKGGQTCVKGIFEDQGAVGPCSWQDRGQEEGPSLPSSSNNREVEG